MPGRGEIHCVVTEDQPLESGAKMQLGPVRRVSISGLLGVVRHPLAAIL